MDPQVINSVFTWIIITFLTWLISQVPGLKKWFSEHPNLRSLAIAAVVGAVTAGAIAYVTTPTSKWIYKSWKRQYVEIANWVSTDCSPRDDSGIKGFIFGDDDIHIWCRVDKSGAVWIPDTTKTWANNSANYLAKEFEDNFAKRNAALIGLLPGSQATIFLLKKR